MNANRDNIALLMSPIGQPNKMYILRLAAIIGTLFISISAKALEVVSWNLGSGGAKISNLTQQLSELEGIDIFGLSEVQPDWKAPILQALNQGDGNFDGVISEQGRSDRLMIAFNKSKVTLLEHFRISEVNIEGRVRPAFVGKFLEIGSGEKFYFMVNHLYHSNKSARIKQSKILNDWAKSKELPVIAVGDYNYDWDIPSNGEERDRGFDAFTANNTFVWIAPTNKIKTQCSPRYNSILDFVFVSPKYAQDSAQSKILFDEPDYCTKAPHKDSDHRPVWAKIPLTHPMNELTQNDLATSAKLREIDDIYSLLSLAIVYKHWQTENQPSEKRRGHNIGSVLVDPHGMPVYWARNARHITENASQHGEVRLITNYLMCPNTPSYLGGDSGNYTLYSSLEPCLMCTGMMALTKVSRGVFVQADPGYGHVMERLTKDHSHEGGLGPYPRTFPMTQSNSPESSLLDKKYSEWIAETGNQSITSFLTSDSAEAIFKLASKRLKEFNTTHGNEDILNAANRYLENVPSTYISDMASQCPSSY